MPVLDFTGTLEGVGAVTVVGVDPFSLYPDAPGSWTSMGDSARAAVASTALANRLALREGARVRISGQEFTLAGTLEAANAEFIALDIATAQSAFGRYGKLDRIDVYVGPGEEFEVVESRLRKMLPESYFLTRPGARSQENQRMLRAFRWNLRMLSWISLVVGAFLIYNTIAISVVRRRPEIGILRAVGTSRRQIRWLFLGEAVMLALAGSVAGVFLGRIMAEGAVQLIGDTVNSLYASSRPSPVALDWTSGLLGIAAGVAVAFVSAWGPARQASSVPPTEAMQRGSREHQTRVRWRRGLGRALVMSLLALAAARQEAVDGVPVFGFASALLAIAALAFAIPAMVVGIASITKRALQRMFGAEGVLAIRSLEGSLGRTSVIVGALATAVAVMASVAIMVGSFRQTVEVWLGYQLRADLYLRPVDRSGAGHFPALPRELPDRIRALPCVDAVDVLRALEIRYRGERVNIGAPVFAVLQSRGGLKFLSGGWPADPGIPGAIVSEPFANRHRVRTGEVLELPFGGGALRVKVSGIYYDYSSSQGWVMVDRATLLEHLPDHPPTSVAIYVTGKLDKVQRGVQLLAAGSDVEISRNQALRQSALRVFDRTFAITWGLEAVAILVAMLGAANSLLALVLDRRRELGLLRYLGASVLQLRRVILLEAGFLGLLANVLGLALGFVLSLLLIFVINQQSFGWTIQFYPPYKLLGGASILIWCATVLAAFYPARVAGRLNPVEVIHEE
jgi:putative ABC transport system permease protein